MSVDFFDFYWEYHGHTPEHLDAAHAALLASKGGAEEEPGFIYFIGDSSLDNKYWFGDQRPAVGAYADVLQPPTSVCDVTYWLNALSESDRFQSSSDYGSKNCVKYAAINTAVEATSPGSFP